MSSPEKKQLIWDLIKEIKVGMLVTQDDSEHILRARPMHLVQKAYDGTLYFYTPKTAAKVYELVEHRNVCVTFSDTKDQTYVSLSGTARLTNDRSLIEKYWSKWIGMWFDGGPEDPEVTMLEVKINSGEYWDSTNNKFVQLFEMAKASLLDTTAKTGDNKKF